MLAIHNRRKEDVMVRLLKPNPLEPRPVRRRWRTLLPVVISLLLSACAASPSVLAPASSISGDEASLYQIVLCLALGVFIIVEGLLVYTSIRFRRRKGDESIPKQVEGSLRLEFIWTAIPVILVLILFVLSLGTVRAVAAPPPGESDIHLHVVGHQWWWEFQYPDYGFTTANELHIPLGGTVQISLDSMDVIHSFWVPQLSGKVDVIPGQTNSLWLKADQIGEYHGQCAEFCGSNHANMRIKVVVETPSDFNAWVANQQQPPPAPANDLEQSGYDLITNGICSNCHTLGDHKAKQKEIGPNLTHLFSRSVFAGATYPLNESNLRRWLADTQAMKPGNDMIISLSPGDIDGLVAYLMRLK
jgi:cytochrome c oxidase subunit 2